MKLFRVLHLSDIHIGNTYANPQDIAYRIISSIEDEKLSNIQCVIVTGDIFEGRLGFSSSLVSEAVNFFNVLYEELQNTTSLKKEDFLFVPGNHDIVRAEEVSIRWGKYKSFLENFYGTIPEFYSLQDFSLLKVYHESRIAFVGFNSVALKAEPNIDPLLYSRLAKVDESQYSSAGIDKANMLKFLDSQAQNKEYVDFGEINPSQLLARKRELMPFDDYNIVAFFHHHFYLFPEVYNKYGDSSLIRNYTSIIQQMQQFRVQTVLHGHKHFDLERPLITDSYYDNPSSVINIIAGGSVGTDRLQRHTFNVVDFFDRDSNIQLVQRKFIYNNDQLEPVVIRQIPPQTRYTRTHISLLNSFKLDNPDLFSQYSAAIEKLNIIADDYQNMLNWLENVFSGFDEIQKVFSNDSYSIFYLLFATIYRLLCLKQSIGNENICPSYYSILKNLLDECIPEVGFDQEKYLSLFEETDLNTVERSSDAIFNAIQSQKSKCYFSLSMIAIFFTDVYLMLRYYAGSFYKRHIQYKVNIRLDEMEFHQNVPVHKIMIHSDADRRSAYIDLRCNTATSHKLAVLFVKEFELIISKFEEYFKTVGLKLYYISPRIEHKRLPHAIDNYNFEAYIPTLIPLLTGDNIYARKEVFARELIQNSIDAIAVRAATNTDIDRTIYITFGELNGRKFFRIKDHGTGMDRFKIERYFTSIGRSFYSGNEYSELDIEYKPISNFGIGFLSAFMICREIDVKTKYYLDAQEGLKLHIPNFDGCFFIENDDTVEIGTEITLYIDPTISHNIKPQEIIDYICDTMQDISNDILIRDELGHQEIKIKARHIRNELPPDGFLFIPFSEEQGTVVKDSQSQSTIWNKDSVNTYPFGMLIDISGKSRLNTVLNSGIKLNDTNIDDTWRLLLLKDIQSHPHMFDSMLFNFPPNFLNIDVSREKITDFAPTLHVSNFKYNLFDEIGNKIRQFISMCQQTQVQYSALKLHTVMMALTYVSKQDKELTGFTESMMSMRYVLYLRISEKRLELIVSTPNNKPINSIAFSYNNYKKIHQILKDFLLSIDSLDTQFFSDSLRQRLMSIFSLGYRDLMLMRTPLFSNVYETPNLLHFDAYSDKNLPAEVMEHLQKQLKSKDKKVVYSLFLLLAFSTQKDGKDDCRIISNNLLTFLLDQFTISQIENGLATVCLQYEDFKKVISRTA